MTTKGEHMTMTDTIAGTTPPGVPTEPHGDTGTASRCPRAATTFALGCTCVDCGGPLTIINQTPITEAFRGGHIQNQAQSTILECERCAVEHEYRGILIRNAVRNVGRWT